MRFNHILFSCLLLALLAAPGFSYTLSGTISGAQLLGGISYVYAFHVDTLNLTPYIGIEPLGNGPYWIFNVPAGSYILFGFQDRDGNLLPSLGDLMAFYGDSLPTVIQVSGNMTNLNIALSALPVTGISGTISCPAGPTGPTYVQAATDPLFHNVVGIGFLTDQTGNGTYTVLVDSGQYYVRTFMDVDLNFTPSHGDPQTYWGYPNNPIMINITSHAVTNVNMALLLPPGVNIALTPQGAPIVIPPSGGSFSYSANITNSDRVAHTEKIWANLTLPDSSTQPVLGPLTLNLPAGVSITRVRAQNVPSSAPAGNYSFNGFLGTNVYLVWASSSFAFTKSGFGIRDSGISDWTSSGEPFTSEEAISSQPSAFSLLGASPNPFNPTTVLSYELRVPSQVSLKVYDTTGRLVATLVNGWREAGTHQVTFDGSNLASGVYLYTLTAGNNSATGKMVLMK